MRRMLPLPSPSTLIQLLKSYKMCPGINKRSVAMLNVKVSPKDDTDKLAFILMDEMSLRKGLSKSEPNDKTVGYEDDDKHKSGKLVTSSLCVMAVGVKRQ